MKKKVVLKVNSYRKALKVVQNNYPNYAIDSKETEEWVTGRVHIIHLAYKNDYITSLTAFYYPSEDILEIEKSNGNQTRKYRELCGYRI